MTPVNQVVLINSLVIVALLIVALVKKQQSEGLKLFLFTGIVAATAITTLYLSIDTVIRNQNSQTKGPVHWHADFEIFACGQIQNKQQVMGKTIAHEGEEDAHAEIDLKNPSGISNRIGNSNFHEHGDNRIHVEGVVEKLEDIQLAKFFEVIGGQLTKTFIRVPTNEGEIILQNGIDCPNGEKGTLQVFVYKTKGKKIIQEKLADFPNYVISPYGQIPPGDCLIFEFGTVKERTDKICDFYKIAINKGEYQYTPSLSPP